MPNRIEMPTRAPALYLLAGMMIGYSLSLKASAPLGLTLTTAFILGALNLCFARKHKASGTWSLCFGAACALTFWSYACLRLPVPPSLSQLAQPEREAHLRLKIIQLMQADSAYGNATGIAEVLEIQPARAIHQNSELFFRISLDEQSPEQIEQGAEVRLTGVIAPIGEPEDPQSFESYLKDRDIHYRLTRTSELERIKAPSNFSSFCQQMNLRLQEILQFGASGHDSQAAVYVAMLLGRKTELNKEQSERFRMTGTMHFFAISGLHIGVIATVIAQFLILIRIPRKVSPFIGLPLLYLYVEITGASPSAVRAFLMALFFWASFAFARQRSPLAALAASAVFVLIIQPTQLWSIGFQLSYTVVLSILLFGLPFYHMSSQALAPFQYLPRDSWLGTQRAYAWVQDKGLLLLAISSSAWLASAPLSAAFFGYISPGAILLNMLLVNLAALVISGGIISLGIGLVGLSGVSGFLNHAAWLNISLMEWLVELSLHVPGGIWHCDGFPRALSYTALIIYFALLFWLNTTRWGRKPLIWAAAPTLIIAVLLFGVLLS